MPGLDRSKAALVAALLGFMLAASACCTFRPSPSWSKADWIEEALDAVAGGRYPLIRAVSYWSERWENDDGSTSDLRVDSSSAALTAYQAGVDDPIFTTNPVFTGLKLTTPASGGVYHAAFPDFGGSEDEVSAHRIAAFETTAAKRIAWAYFSDNWLGGVIAFPAADVAAIHGAGRVPFIRMMMRSRFGQGADPVFTLLKISNGTYDAELAAWFAAAKSVGYPLLVEFGTEVNGDWFPWNGVWNGGSTLGPDRFKSAYRHLVDLYRVAPGADNITWFFHVNAGSSPDEPWNSPAAYYPGDEYVDWIGVSVYGPQSPAEDYESFVSILDRVYPSLAALAATGSKPLAALEFGVAEP